MILSRHDSAILRDFAAQTVLNRRTRRQRSKELCALCLLMVKIPCPEVAGEICATVIDRRYNVDVARFRGFFTTDFTDFTDKFSMLTSIPHP